jgi:hypothetical protein
LLSLSRYHHAFAAHRKGSSHNQISVFQHLFFSVNQLYG